MKMFHVKLNDPSVAEDGNMFHQNFGIHLQECVISLHRRPQMGYKSVWYGCYVFISFILT